MIARIFKKNNTKCLNVQFCWLLLLMHYAGDVFNVLPCFSAGSIKATPSDSLSAIRSSSTLPIAEPSTEPPPTPTRMAGAANTFQFEDRGEDRGDLIKFYNSVRIFHSVLDTKAKCILATAVCLSARLQTWRALIFSRVCLCVCLSLTSTSTLQRWPILMKLGHRDPTVI